MYSRRLCVVGRAACGGLAGAGHLLAHRGHVAAGSSEKPEQFGICVWTDGDGGLLDDRRRAVDHIGGHPPLPAGCSKNDLHQSEL